MKRKRSITVSTPIQLFLTLILTITLLSACGSPAAPAAPSSPSAAAHASDGQPSQPAPASPAPASSPSPVAELLANGEISGSLTVSCYETTGVKNMLDDAARLFEAQYPGTAITVESFSKPPEVQTIQNEDGTVSYMSSSVDDPQAKKDYISRMNTEIMGGGGPDVFGVDVLPFYKYTAGGYFENLYEYMAADGGFDPQDYYSNLFDAAAINGALGAVPLEYYFEYAAYDSTLFSEEEQAALDAMGNVSFEDLLEFGREPFARVNGGAAQPTYMFEMSPDQGLANLLFRQHYASFLDIPAKKANFDDGMFASMLEYVTMNGEGGFFQPSDFNWENLPERCMFKIKGSYALLRDLTTDPERRNRFGVGSAYKDEDDKIIGLLQGSGSPAAFSFPAGAAINSNSPNKRLAWEFVKFLLGFEAQTLPSVYFFPVNKAALAEQGRLMMTGQLYEFDDAEAALDGAGERDLAAYVDAVGRLTAQIGAYLVEDEIITEMVNTEAGLYFTEGKPAEDAAAAIQSKVSLYLSE